MSEAFRQAVEWLYSLEAARGMDFKLERVTLALEYLGRPQERFGAVHIGGTNGKGSVAAMIHAVLGAAGCRVGLYTSPHLVRVTERIRVGEREIDPDEMAEWVAKVRRATCARGVHLTFFEFLTALALDYFAAQRVDLAVLEVGLGGRLDATNVIVPEVAAITTVGMDHEEFLGETLEQIAAEKAGIVKRGRPCVLGRVPHPARSVVRAAAAERGSPMYELDAHFSIEPCAGAMRYRGMRRSIDGIRLGLLGAHQWDNAAVALAAVELVPGLSVSDEAVRRGLAGVRWPGRLEVVSGPPLVVLDGAHNPDGIEALVRETRALLDGYRTRLLFAVMRDKRWAPMVSRLGPLVEEVVVTSIGGARGEDPRKLAEAFARYAPVRVVPDAAEAFQWLCATSASADAVLVTGSLFLVGAVYPLLATEIRCLQPDERAD